MLLKSNHSTIQEHCVSCRYALQSETSNTGLRCGKSYYASPATYRKPIPHNNYPVVQSKDHCVSWTTNINQVLKPPVKKSPTHQGPSSNSLNFA